MARAFNGSSTYLSTSAILGATGTSSRAFSMWVRTTAAVSTRQFIFSEGNESGSFTRFALELESSKFTINIRSTALAASSHTPVQNTWHHLLLVYAVSNSGQAFTLYIDGVQHANDGLAPIDTPSGSAFNIGRFYGGSLYWQGQIAEFAKYQGQTGVPTPDALGTKDAASLAKGRRPTSVRPDLLDFYAPLVREVIDLQGGASITDNGPTSAADHPRMYR